MRKPKVTKLYQKLSHMADSGQYKTGWKSVADICMFMFDAMTMGNMTKTQAAIGQARRALRVHKKAFFYHNQKEGFILLKTVDHHREAIKGLTYKAEGSMIAAERIYTIGSAKLPGLRGYFNAGVIKSIEGAIKDAARKPKGK